MKQTHDLDGSADIQAEVSDTMAVNGQEGDVL